ncbi:hypothetical protein HG535_0D02330 [Zygotorulaspora mrakii]|uniref:DUF7593 domain-containing protein n=1 Tax=Zygotorulaspora mrakii TaxID=42260 RepID=A0A7H9B1I8_ZYGMR|nr:uncharacterized protein HG535_0D02330 [Zygotorulaspora mrakii]QLG72525.1 hypothetical protein HG535_0D02330 [Zygotorulaspora mrakii]
MSTVSGSDLPVKKRTLSSYLSNVTSRREELEKLKFQQDVKREDIIQEDVKQEDVKQEDVKQEDVRQENVKQENLKQQQEQDSVETEQTLKQAIRGLEKKELTTEPQTEQQYDHEIDRNRQDIPYNHKEVDTRKSDEKSSAQSSLQEQVLEFKQTALISGSDQFNVQESVPQTERSGSEDRSPEAPVKPLYRNDLHRALRDPENKAYEQELSSEGNNENHIRHNDDEKLETNSDEIDSDAPTEPASPPKPRRRRLIRADRLSSLSPRNNVFDNDSDSELSDIDELKSLQLSSSILHEDSSPTRQARHNYRESQQSSSPRKGSPKKPRAHFAVSKVPKQKRGLYRDAGGRTRLQIACDKGNYDLAKKLIEEENYDVNDQDNAGNTALHEAALNGHLELVKLLKKHGADVNIQSFEMFKDTPLIDASANGHLDVVVYLLDHGADPTISNAKDLTAYESIEEESDLDEQEREIVHGIRNCLRSAARKRNNAELPVGKISENAAPIGERASPTINRQIEEPLGDYEFFWTDITSKAGREKLFKASKDGKLAYVGAYLENGGRVDVKSFFEAVKFGHEDIASLFLAFGAEVNAVLKDGTTALMNSVGRGHVGTVKLLIAAGADPTKKNKKGHTALYYAQNSAMGVLEPEEIEILRETIKKYAYDNEKDGKIRKDAADGISSKKKTIPVRNKEDESDNEIQEATNSSLPQNHEGEMNSDAGGIFNDKDNAVAKPNDKGNDSNDSNYNSPSCDAEHIVNTGRKRKTLSPIPLPTKRQALSPGSMPLTENSDAISTAKILNSDIKVDQASGNVVVRANEETPEEKEQKLKAEEEYIQKRLQNKKKKEQELLRKLAEDEEKREQEKQKQKVEEVRKLERQQKERQMELGKRKQEAELARRKEVRAMYPLGLKLIDFRDNKDYLDYLPLYYIEKRSIRDGSDAEGDVRYVLDLQVCVILKDKTIFSSQSAIKERIEVSPAHNQQLWNVLRFILLCGGYRNSRNDYKYFVDLYGNSLEARIQFETNEYRKFLQLPLHWIRWDDINIDDPLMRERIQREMIELSLIDPSTTGPSPIFSHSSTPASSSEALPQAPETRKLPIKFQHRESTSWLSDPSSARPMW